MKSEYTKNSPGSISHGSMAEEVADIIGITVGRTGLLKGQPGSQGNGQENGRHFF